MDEGISHLRSLARILREATYAGGEWDARFREHWVAIVRDCGHSIANPDADVEPIRDRLTPWPKTCRTTRTSPRARGRPMARSSPTCATSPRSSTMSRPPAKPGRTINHPAILRHETRDDSSLQFVFYG